MTHFAADPAEPALRVEDVVSMPEVDFTVRPAWASIESPIVSEFFNREPISVKSSLASCM